MGAFEWFLIAIIILIHSVVSGWIQGRMVALRLDHQETKIENAYKRADDAFCHATKAHLKVDDLSNRFHQREDDSRPKKHHRGEDAE